MQRRFGLRLLQWAAQFHSDYCDCLFDQAHIDALGTVWRTMSQAGGFDLINLQQVRPDAQCRRCIGISGSNAAHCRSLNQNSLAN